MPTFSPERLTDGVTKTFAACGVPAEAALVVTEHLVEAELSGVTSHGLIRVPQYVDALEEGHITVDAELSVKSSTAGTAVVDGHGGLGQVMARGAMDLAVEKASECGIGAATLVNCSHTGRLASYSLQAAERGMVGMVMVNAGGCGQWVAPFGGIEGRLGTNPVSFAVPTGDDAPLFIDIATSIAPEGKVRAWSTAGRELPEGWLRDSKGNPTTNPADLYEGGALQPFGGHKGYGLSLMVDLLAGGLSGAGVCSQIDAPKAGATDGVFLLAVNIEAFCPLPMFAQLAGQLIGHVKSSPPAPGFDEVLVAGEREAKTRKERLANGIPIDDKTWETIRAPLDRFGIEVETL